MKKIVFLAPYPTDENIQDGYFQRVKNIDNVFLSEERVYLYISYKKRIKEYHLENENLSVYALNFFTSIKKIRNLINSCQYVYCHSIYRFFPAYLFFNKKQIVILDFHGIVPEELDYSGKKIASKFFAFIEKKAIKRVNKIVVVTHAMQNYIGKKYNPSNIQFIFYPIITKNVINNQNNALEKKDNNEITFVYSGNCQPWQRVKDVIYFMNNHNFENYTYYILTLDIEKINILLQEELVKDFKGKIIIKTVLPSELGQYYSIADYGFLIRDAHPLNYVANPTKAMEYLFYGLKLIVDTVDIGDYKGFEYIKYDDNNIICKKGKSEKNKELALNILNQNNDNLYEMVLR